MRSLVKVTVSSLLFLMLLATSSSTYERMVLIKKDKVTVKLPAEQQKEFLRQCSPVDYEIMAGGGRPYYNEERTIEVNSFYIDKFPVSMLEYLAFCQEHKIPVPDRISFLQKDDHFGQLPAVGISWRDADFYCRSKSKRLPKKEEYEYLMYRDGFFPFDIYKKLTIHAEGKEDKLLPIGSNPVDVSSRGVVDIYSNTFEWTINDGCALNQNNYFQETMTYCKEVRIMKKAPFNFGCKYLDIFKEEMGSIDNAYLNQGFRCAADAEGAE